MKQSNDIGELILAIFLVVSMTIIGWYAFNYVFVERNIIIHATWETSPMTSPTHDNYTDQELERIEWFKNAGPCLREEMIMTYETIYRTAEDEEIRESCERLLEGMRGEI